MGARSWQELEGIARTHSTCLNQVHVSALVCRLPKVVTPALLSKPEKSQFSRFLGEVSDLVTARLDTFDPRALANVLWAVSKLGYSPAPTTLNKFLFEAYVRMYDFNAQELANLAWALATLAAMGNRPVPVWLHKYTLAAVSRVPDLKPQELANLAWALSKLFPPVVAPLVASPSQPPSVAPVAAGASPRPGAGSGSLPAAQAAGSPPPGAAGDGDASRRLHSPATAPSNPSASQPSPSASPNRSSSVARAPSMNAESLASAGNSAAALPDLVAALTSGAAMLVHRFRCGELVMAVLAIHTLDPPAGLRLLRQALPHLLRTAEGDLSPQDVSNLWQVLGKCAADSSLGAELLPPARTTSGRSLSAKPAGARAVPGATCAGAQGGQAAGIWLPAAGRALPEGPGQQPLGRHHLHALFDVTVGSLHGFTAQGLCLTLWSWARLRLTPSDAAVQAVFQRFCQVLPAQATFQCIAITLWAAAQLGLRPPAPAMALFESCARLQLSASKLGERRALLLALQQMRYRPSVALLEALNGRLRDAADQLQPTELQSILSAYDVFGVHVPRPVRVRALDVVVTAVATKDRIAGTAAATSGRGGSPSSGAPTAPVPLSAAAAAGGGASAMAPQLWRSPREAVCYFAALVGLGAGAAPVGSRRRHAIVKKVTMLRARLEASAELRNSLRATIEGAVGGRLQELDARTFCTLLAVLVRLRLQPRGAFLLEVHEQVAARAGGLSHWHAGALLAALGRLNPRPRPPSEALAVLLTTLEPHFESLPDGHLLAVVHSLARLRYRPSGRWLRRYFAECMARVDGWPAAKLEVFLRSLVALGLKLKGAPCRQLQVVVYRRKQRAGPGGAEAGAGAGAVQPAAKGVDLKGSLCQLCSGLSGCTV